MVTEIDLRMIIIDNVCFNVCSFDGTNIQYMYLDQPLLPYVHRIHKFSVYWFVYTLKWRCQEVTIHHNDVSKSYCYLPEVQQYVC